MATAADESEMSSDFNLKIIELEMEVQAAQSQLVVLVYFFGRPGGPWVLMPG